MSLDPGQRWVAIRILGKVGGPEAETVLSNCCAIQKLILAQLRPVRWVIQAISVS